MASLALYLIAAFWTAAAHKQQLAQTHYHRQSKSWKLLKCLYKQKNLDAKNQRKHHGYNGSTYAPRWGLIDLRNQVAGLEEEERRELALQKVREGYLARPRAEERKGNWHSYKEAFMVQSDPKDMDVLLRKIIGRIQLSPRQVQQVVALWKHSIDLT